MFSIYFFIWPIISAVLVMGFCFLSEKKVPIFRPIFMFVFAYIMSWFFLPSFALDMGSTWLMGILMTSVAAGLALLNREGSEKRFLGFSVPSVLLICLLVGGLSSCGAFHAESYANLADVTNHGQKESTLELVSQDKAQRVTSSLALKRAEELIGDSAENGLRSRAEFGAMYGNVTPDGEAVWMAPLEPRTFFRWWSNPTTPGYFMASHVNSADSRLIQDKPISYGSGFYLSNNLERHLYTNGYVNYSYGEVFFQIDNEGNPHYVVPLERPQVVMGGYMPEKWVVIDASDGRITEFDTPETLPNWVDRAYPEDTMTARLDDWGCYSAGWWACWFSGENVIEPTPGMIVTMDTNSEMVYYTGTQFATANDESGATSGVGTINARTGHIDFYRRAGITEQAAVDTINGAIANFAGRTASFPLLIQINGLETYFMVIMDESGAQKGYGMVWQRNRNAWGIGDSVEEAMRAYLRRARENRELSAFEGNSEVVEIEFTGTVLATNPVIRGGETTFYLRLAGVPDKVFAVSTVNPAEIAVTQVGQRVRITTVNADPAVVEADVFDNLDISLVESVAQQNLDEVVAATNERVDSERNASDLQTRLQGMDDESVSELLQQTQ